MITTLVLKQKYIIDRGSRWDKIEVCSLTIYRIALIFFLYMSDTILVYVLETHKMYFLPSFDNYKLTYFQPSKIIEKMDMFQFVKYKTLIRSVALEIKTEESIQQ
jgi:hypothetical protein